MKNVMEYLLMATFFLYLASSIAFVVEVSRNKEKREESWLGSWGKLAISMTILGVVSQTAFIITRIIIGGHFPTSNMFEFTAFLCYTLALAFIVIFFMYRTVALGAFAMPLAVILLAYAAVFPRDVQPLIPALQSYWLYVHVTTAALGQGAFAVGFVAGLIYLIHQVGNEKRGKHAFWLEVILVTLLMFVTFSTVSFIFSSMNYQVTFSHPVDGQTIQETYSLPPIAGPYDGKVVQSTGMKAALFTAPEWIKGAKAASKLNSVLWAVLSALVGYGLYRLLVRKRLGELLYPLVKKLDPELLDEISYRATAIGFPIFTLGALIFAMIWAHEAWGHYWNWDPKEDWALATWLFYAAYLHLRLGRGWVGLRSAWLVVGGFAIIMINLIVVNFLLAGLHTYA